MGKCIRIHLSVFLAIGILVTVLSHTAHARWQPIGLERMRVRAVLVQGEVIYAGTDRGVWKKGVREDQWINLGLNGDVSALAYDPARDVLFAVADRIPYLLNGGERRGWSPLLGDDDLSNDEQVTDIVCDVRTGNAFIGTTKGISLWAAGGGVRSITERQLEEVSVSHLLYGESHLYAVLGDAVIRHTSANFLDAPDIFHMVADYAGLRSEDGISAVAFGADEHTLYAGLWRGEGGLFRRGIGDEAWNRECRNMCQNTISSIVHDASREVTYVGVFSGEFGWGGAYQVDANGDWSRIGNLGDVGTVHSLFLDAPRNALYAGTMRGMFRFSLFPVNRNVRDAMNRQRNALDAGSLVIDPPSREDVLDRLDGARGVEPQAEPQAEAETPGGPSSVSPPSSSPPPTPAPSLAAEGGCRLMPSSSDLRDLLPMIFGFLLPLLAVASSRSRFAGRSRWDRQGGR